MRITFLGIDAAVECIPGQVSVLEVENKTLFSGVCQSLLSGRRDQAVEPYYLWDDEGEPLKASESPLVIGNPFSLPWEDKIIVGALYGRLERCLIDDESVRASVEGLAEALSGRMDDLVLDLEGDYAFGIEWRLSRYLKAFGFRPECAETDRLIDNLEKFLAVAADAGVRKAIVFFNLKNFLEDFEIERLYEQVKILNLSVFLVESRYDSNRYENELKIGIDQHFIEY